MTTPRPTNQATFTLNFIMSAQITDPLDQLNNPIFIKKGIKAKGGSSASPIQHWLFNDGSMLSYMGIGFIVTPK